MPGKPCPKCRKIGNSSIECDFCGTNFEEYERQKQESIGQVYQLISAGDLNGARKLAEKLPAEFPDSKGDFLLLLSNINRDISVVERYHQALESFDRGDFSEAVLLLRNIKAFDKVLDEKVISLRRKAERYGDHDTIFHQAVEKYNAGRFAAAKALFKGIDGYKFQEEVDDYLRKIDELKADLFRSAVELLNNNKFDSALAKLDELHGIFPEIGHETEGYVAIIAEKNEIKDRLLAVAGKALEEERFLESKVIFSFLGWQYPELQPTLTPYIEEVGSRARISLADFAGEGTVDFAALGLYVNSDGFFESACTETQSVGIGHLADQLIDTAPVAINPEPIADLASEAVDIDGEDVADFIC